jgi:hypothetical protein
MAGWATVRVCTIQFPGMACPSTTVALTEGTIGAKTLPQPATSVAATDQGRMAWGMGDSGRRNGW